MSKTFRTCKLEKAIEHLDPTFYNAIDNNCLTYVLYGGRGGKTFLFPKSEKVRKNIIASLKDGGVEGSIKIKALAVYGNFKTPEDMNGATNVLRQVVSVSDDKWGPFTIKPADNIEFFDERKQFNIMYLEGEGQIPTSEPESMGKPKKNKEDDEEPKIGGFNPLSNPRKDLSNKLVSCYLNEKNKKSNVFVKKVFVHLCMIRKNPDLFNKNILSYLGNEEISDYFLLDMYSSECCTELYEIFGGAKDDLGEMIEDKIPTGEFAGKSYWEAYIQLKNTICTQFCPEDVLKTTIQQNFNEQKNLIQSRNLRKTDQIRDAIYIKYGKEKNRLGKDLLITLISVMREMASHEMDDTTLKQLFYVLMNVYLTPESICASSSFIGRDLTLYVNLLKCELYKFVPTTNISLYSEIYGTATDVSLDRLEFFCFTKHFYEENNKKVGGGLLEKYI